ncbi:MAG: hypothetical protein ACRDOE_17020, partial [Streptosporangiaceae bacterium]
MPPPGNEPGNEHRDGIGSARCGALLRSASGPTWRCGCSRALAQLGLFDAGDGYARYQHVETDPEARRRGLAGTLVWHTGRYGREVLGASTFVI